MWLRVCMCLSVHVCVRVLVYVRACVHVFALDIACLSSVVVQAAVGGEYRVVCVRARAICMAAQAAGA